MSPTELETFVRQRYNAVGDTFYPQAEIFNFFWQAQMQLAIKTKCIKSIYTTSSVADQRAYDFPTNAISIYRIEYDGRKISRTDHDDDDAETGNNPGTTSTGTPICYQEWGRLFYLRPIPSAIATVRIFTIDKPAQPTASGALDVPEMYHLDLADYALGCMFAQDKNHVMAQKHFDKWDDNLDKAVAAEALLRLSDGYTVVKDVSDLYLDPRY